MQKNLYGEIRDYSLTQLYHILYEISQIKKSQHNPIHLRLVFYFYGCYITK